MTRYDYDTWFVYELIDPRSKLVFYIGKTATPRARLSAHKTSPESAAYPVIGEIRRAGFEVEMYCIGRFNTEAEALDYEGYLISKTPNLVNRMGYFNPTDEFIRPAVGVDELIYTNLDNQPVPDEETIVQALEAQMPDIPTEYILRIVRAQSVLLSEDHEYQGVTDE